MAERTAGQSIDSSQTTRHNLPAQLTMLIGREREVGAVRALLQRPEIRLVTLTGTGGIGKTRLGLQVATELRDMFPDGVFFVSLAPITDPDLVIPTIAESLGLKEIGGRILLDLLKAYLHDKCLLLVLDNFEQVLPAYMQIVDLLGTCPQLKVLVTSRTVLHVRGEHEFVVPPLAVPDPRCLPDLLTLSDFEAVALFLQRAQAVKAEFHLTDANAKPIVEICVRLDGLPLAIELAAARVKLLSPEALLTRLMHQLTVLTGGMRDVPAHQQTMRDTIEWSYHLLGTREQQLFRRLSVFVGGCTLEAIEALCATLDGGERALLDEVTSLIDQSLLQQRGEESRLVMLEMIREYGLNCLTTSQELEATRQAHADYYLFMVVETDSEIMDQQQQGAGGDQLEREHENLRAALNCLLERNQAEKALRMANAMGSGFWIEHFHFSEGRAFLERALAATQGEVSNLRAQAFGGLGLLSILSGDLDRAEECAAEHLAQSRNLGNTMGVAQSLAGLGLIAYLKSDYGAACALHEESLANFKMLGDRAGYAMTLSNLADIAIDQGEYDRAQTLAEESLAIYRELGERFGIIYALERLVNESFDRGDHTRAYTIAEEGLRHCIEESLYLRPEILYLQGKIALQQGDLKRASQLAEEILTLTRDRDEGKGNFLLLALLGRVAAAKGHYSQARTYFIKSIDVARERGRKPGIAFGLEGLASVVAVHDELAWAVRLWGAAATVREAISAPLPPVYRDEYDRSIAAACTRLGKQSFEAAWAEGRSMTPQAALSAQGRVVPPPQPILIESASTHPAKSGVTYPDGLTAREVEVLRFIAQGLTDAHIAEQLVISRRTVNTHLTSIYSKIQVSSRSGATRYAIEHHLV